jgi:predicted transcriptional regulator of viral defense system
MKDAEKKLFEIADRQQGYFTAQQAIQAGYHKATRWHHVNRGNWVREGRGIYRLTNFPFSEQGQYIELALWSMNRKGEIEGVFSHETALSLYDVSDANPSKIHMTVPKHFRRHSKIPEVLVLHKGNISQYDIKNERGFNITTPLRTLLDLVHEGATQDFIIEQALKEFFKSGLISYRELEIIKGTDISDSIKQRIAKIIV